MRRSGARKLAVGLVLWRGTWRLQRLPIAVEIPSQGTDQADLKFYQWNLLWNAVQKKTEALYLF
jgi:hypothetical protein